MLIAQFTPELCRSYQYFMASRDLQPGSVRVRLAVLGRFAKWAVKHSRLEKNSMESSRCRRRRPVSRACRSGKRSRSSSRGVRGSVTRPCSR